ncbi:formylmethanofuran dehydrogenase subunit E [Candidatus Magnetoovum chiemensis]|nr:formylmethanofuran dehydrogenase subunit E [Candidatus Magnetoovum chiemensis]
MIKPEYLKLIKAYNFDELLDNSALIHGHLCAGQALGVRMSMLGLSGVAIEEPKGKDRKKLIVYVEIDRCATDAVSSVTGCSLGHRTLKFLDYGKMAATFLNIAENKALRIVAKESSRQKARTYYPDEQDIYKAQLMAYKEMPYDELFDCMEVTVEIAKQDLPGRPISRVPCAKCGEYVQDLREIIINGNAVCKNCSGNSYYEIKK